MDDLGPAFVVVFFGEIGSFSGICDLFRIWLSGVCRSRPADRRAGSPAVSPAVTGCRSCPALPGCRANMGLRSCGFRHYGVPAMRGDEVGRVRITNASLTAWL